jgi:methylmalonyl-CoA mutase N-terminal domain/subunit
MPPKKPSSVFDNPVADSPISDITDKRHPSDSEKRWAEKTLLPSLEKSPEKPIGAATGSNIDDNGRARFTTISGVPIRRLYTEADLPNDWDY